MVTWVKCPEEMSQGYMDPGGGWFKAEGMGNMKAACEEQRGPGWLQGGGRWGRWRAEVREVTTGSIYDL